MIAGGGERGAGSGQFAGEGEASVAGDGVAYVHQGLAADPFDVGDLEGRLFRMAGEHPPGQFALQGDQRERVAEQVVQVTGEAQALLVGGELRHRGASLTQLHGGAYQLAYAGHGESAEQCGQEQAGDQVPRALAADGEAEPRHQGGHGGDQLYRRPAAAVRRRRQTLT